jgi:hypothetical protein
MVISGRIYRCIYQHYFGDINSIMALSTLALSKMFFETKESLYVSLYLIYENDFT